MFDIWFCFCNVNQLVLVCIIVKLVQKFRPVCVGWICKEFLSFIYTVSQKNIPNIFDCNLQINHPILIILV